MNQHTTTDARAGAAARDDRPRRRSLRWRVVDIVTCAVIGVAMGLVFWAWDVTGAGLEGPLDSLAMGSHGLLLGVWLLGGTVAGLVVRKPGAALLGEMVASFVELIPGNQWGPDGVVSGLVQGIGAELVLALFLYRRFGLAVATLAGAVAAVPEIAHMYINQNAAKGLGYNLVYAATCIISGALAGIVSWLLVRALAKTGALNQFAAGREARGTVD